ncbi:MAG: hypothetical protein RL563_2659 [Pseudomonadota bacterium]
MPKHKPVILTLPPGAGGMAFPSAEQLGMELRDWFAGMALIGITSRGAIEPAIASHSAYAFADHMINKKLQAKSKLE